MIAWLYSFECVQNWLIRSSNGTWNQKKNEQFWNNEDDTQNI